MDIVTLALAKKSGSGGGGSAVISKDGLLEQLKLMPSAAADGKIVQYIGPTDSTYTSGYFYKYNDEASKWENVETQGISDLEGFLPQLSTLPAEYSTTKIVQYIGETVGDLTNGYFYRFNGTKWENVLIQPMPMSGVRCTVSKSGYVTTLRAEDELGVTTTYIIDGKDGIDGIDGISPTLSISEEGNWIINSIDTGRPARGEKGEKGDGFKISATYADTDEMVAHTDDIPDSTVVIVESTDTMFIRLEGYSKGDYPGWMEIGGLGDLTVIKGDKGDPGANGTTPTIDPTSKHWMIGEFDTGVLAQGVNGTNGTNGTNGITPNIDSTNHHWVIGGVDTGILAEGSMPTITISARNTWVVNGIDTGKASNPTIDSTTHHWMINGTDTGVLAEGVKGDRGTDGEDGFSPSITSEREENKVVLTINQKSGTSTVDIFDGLHAYNDTEVRGLIAGLQDEVDIINGDETVTGSIDEKIVTAFSKYTSIKFEPVTALPETGVNGVFYLLPSSKPDAKNIYEEYVYVDGKFELVGTTEIDLTPYAKKTELPTKVSDLTNDTGFITGVDIATTAAVGTVKPDGTTIKIDADGTIHGAAETGASAEAGNIIVEKSDGLYAPATDLSAYAKSSTVPVRTSQLTNNGASGTSTYVENSEIKAVAKSGAYSDLSGVPTKLSEFENDLIATTKRAGTVIPDGDTVTVDGLGTITAKIGINSLSRDEGNQIELHEDGIYISALNEDAIYEAIDSVDLASPILTEYTEEELYKLAWEDITVKEKEEYTEEELDGILDSALEGVDLSGIGGGDENVIESISLNGVDVPPDASKNVALTVITNAVDDLVNYYKKSETYTKAEVNSMIAGISSLSIVAVAELPTEDISTSTIYLIPKASPEEKNVKDEYINTTGTSAGWEKIGETTVDLTNYVTTAALTTALADYTTTTVLTGLLAGKQNTLTFDAVPTASSSNVVTSGAIYSALNDKADKVDLSGKQDTLTAGTGIDISASNVISTTARPAVVMTKAEYDSLTEEEKRDGTIRYISDASPSVAVDAVLSSTSENPVQNKVVKTALDSKADASSLATVATSGSYDDLTDKPTIPDGVTVDSALSSTSENPVQNKVINTVLAGKVDSSSLATVATTGSYTDLTDKPTIVNTTYTITQDVTDGHKFTFAGSDGSSTTITIPDDDTSYTLASLGIGNVKNYDQSKAIKSITRSGTTFTYTCLDGTTGTFDQQDNNTWTAMVGATSSANGTAGYVPAPPKTGYNTKYLRADGTWEVPPKGDTNVQSDWNQTTTTADDYIKNKPELATVATSGSYTDLTDTPTIVDESLPADEYGKDLSLVSTSEKYYWNKNIYDIRTNLEKLPHSWYVTCETPAATTNKVISDGESHTSDEIVAGLMVGVKFTYTNTANNVTFSMCGKNNKSIKFNGAVYTGNDPKITGWADHVIYYMFDGNYFVYMGNDANYQDGGINYSTSEQTIGTYNGSNLYQKTIVKGSSNSGIYNSDHTLNSGTQIPVGGYLKISTGIAGINKVLNLFGVDENSTDYKRPVPNYLLDCYYNYDSTSCDIYLKNLTDHALGSYSGNCVTMTIQYVK